MLLEGNVAGGKGGHGVGFCCGERGENVEGRGDESELGNYFEKCINPSITRSLWTL